MKKVLGILLGLMLVMSCASNRMHNTESSIGRYLKLENHSDIPYYRLQFCGVVSSVQRQNNWFWLKLFGNTFEDWAQFAFTDEQGEVHRLEFKVREEFTNTYISREGISERNKAFSHDLTLKYLYPPRLYFYGQTLYDSYFVELFFVDPTRYNGETYVGQGFHRNKNWRVANPNRVIDVECNGYPQEVVDTISGQPY